MRASRAAATGSSDGFVTREPLEASRDAMKAQTKSMRDSTSGVSLDEEMVNLSRYQRAYEAATKLLKTVDDLMAGLIQEIG